MRRYAMDGLELLLGSDTVVYGRADSSTKIGVHDVEEGTTITEARSSLDMWLENTIGAATSAPSATIEMARCRATSS